MAITDITGMPIYVALKGADNSQGTVPSSYAQVSPLANEQYSQLYGQTKGLIPTSLPSLATLIQQGMTSPLLAAVLGPALQRLMGTEDTSRQAVTDAFRASGGLRSSQYGRTFAENEGNIMDKRSGLISDTIAKTLGTLVPAQLQEQKNMMLPGEEFMNLMKLIRPDLVSLPGVNGGGGGGGVINYGSTDLGTPSIFDPSYDKMLADWRARVSPGPASTPGVVGPNYSQPTSPSGGISTPATPYGGYGFDNGGFPIMQNPYTGSYQTYNPTAQQSYYSPQTNQSYQDYGQYVGSYGLGYQAPPAPSNLTYGPWTDQISGEY